MASGEETEVRKSAVAEVEQNKTNRYSSFIIALRMGYQLIVNSFILHYTDVVLTKIKQC